jgi:uncharacterized protein
MAVRIGVVSDTHGHISDQILTHLHTCDEIWHAGDWGDHVYEKLLSLNKPIRGVYGNIDGNLIRQSFKEDMVFTVEGVKIFMTHIGGKPGAYPSSIKSKLAIHSPDLYVCGHSHILKIIYDNKYNMLHLNPGACGNSGFHKVKTLVLFEIESKNIKNMRIVEYDRS